jgi:hypothetical protein
MLDLESAIKHCEEVAEELEEEAVKGCCDDTEIVNNCYECASEHRQLAEWLRELKEIKHLFSVTEKLFRTNFRGGLIDVVDGYDILFSEHMQLREIFEEVNADEASDNDR